jgi:hypothetical protein
MVKRGLCFSIAPSKIEYVQVAINIYSSMKKIEFKIKDTYLCELEGKKNV